MEKVTGKFIKKKYQKNNFYIGRFKTTTKEQFDVLGNFEDFNFKDIYELEGVFVEHETFGKQLRVSAYQTFEDNTEEIKEFIKTEFKLSEAKAEMLAESFEIDLLNVLNSENLETIEGIKKLDIEKITKKLDKDYHSLDIIFKLMIMGFSYKESKFLYNYYKDYVLTLLKVNPYKIYESTKVVSFSSIDFVAKKYEKTEERKLYLIYFYLYSCLQETGSTRLKVDSFYKYFLRKINLSISYDDFSKLLESPLFYIKDDYLTLKEVEEDEKIISEKLKKLTKEVLQIEKNSFLNDVETIEKKLAIKYDKDQIKAIRSSIEGRALVITGGPGTGKTTIIDGIVKLFLNKKIDEKQIALLAPTGRAARRLSEITGLKGSTIHSYLSWNREYDTFQFNEYNKKDEFLIIVDEASMLDNELFASLLKALREDIILILVGDKDQLPSVSFGKVFEDIINSNVVRTVKLKELYRQSKENKIIELAYEINKGMEPSYKMDKRELIQIIEEEKLDLKTSQILIPMYKGRYGITEINNELKEYFNPTYRRIDVKDKIIVLENMPEIGLFNGDIGFVERIHPEMVLNINGELKEIPKTKRNNVMLAYAISIHKAQGSEFDDIILYCYSDYRRMLYRKLYYTGVTRAKKRLFIKGEKEALTKASFTKKEEERKTSLLEKLIKD